MVDDTWYSIALPILEAIANEEKSGLAKLSVGDLAATIKATPTQIDTEIERLLASEHVLAEHYANVMTADVTDNTLVNPRLGAAGTRAVGQWPKDNPYEEFIRLLERKAADEPDAEERTKLQGFLDAAKTVGTGVLTSVLSEYAKSGL